METESRFGPGNPHPLSQMRTEQANMQGQITCKLCNNQHNFVDYP